MNDLEIARRWGEDVAKAIMQNRGSDDEYLDKLISEAEKLISSDLINELLKEYFDAVIGTIQDVRASAVMHVIIQEVDL